MPRGAFGPRLQATVALLGGAYRMSKRQVRAILSDLLGLSASTGMICKIERHAAEAVAAPVEAVGEHVRGAESAGVDETGWREGKRRAWLWAAVTAEATAFRVARSRGADALHALVGEPIAPVIISDRFPTYARARTARSAGPTPSEHNRQIGRGPGSSSGPGPSPSPDPGGSSGPGPEGVLSTWPSGMTCRISSESSPTMIRSISSCKIR